MLSKKEADAAYIHELETQNAKLREAAFTPAELATIRADLAECEREAAINAAAKKVADAAVGYWDVGRFDFDGGNSEHWRIWHELREAVREYRALTEGFAEKLAAAQVDPPPGVDKALSDHFHELFEPLTEGEGKS